NGGVTGTAATVGDNRRGTRHDRFPVRVGHVGNQYVARLYALHILDVGDDAHHAGADTLPDGTALDQHLGTLLLEQVTLHHGHVGTALHRLRARLDDIQLAVVAIQRPLDIHRRTVVLLDGDRLARQLFDLLVSDTEAQAIGLLNGHGLHRTTGGSRLAIHHLLQLGAKRAAQDRRLLVEQRLLVNVELVRVYRTLHDHLAEAVGCSDKAHVTETGLGIQREHHAGGAGFRAHHALDTRRQRHLGVVEALVHAVADGAVIEQGGKYLLHGMDHVVHAADIQEGFLLAGKRGGR